MAALRRFGIARKIQIFQECSNHLRFQQRHSLIVHHSANTNDEPSSSTIDENDRDIDTVFEDQLSSHGLPDGFKWSLKCPVSASELQKTCSNQHYCGQCRETVFTVRDIREMAERVDNGQCVQFIVPDDGWNSNDSDNGTKPKLYDPQDVPSVDENQERDKSDTDPVQDEGDSASSEDTNKDGTGTLPKLKGRIYKTSRPSVDENEKNADSDTDPAQGEGDRANPVTGTKPRRLKGKLSRITLEDIMNDANDQSVLDEGDSANRGNTNSDDDKDSASK